MSILAFLIWKNRQGLQEFAEQKKQWSFLALALALNFTGQILTFVRWHWLVRTLGFPFRLFDACRMGLMGLAVGYIGAGLLGGDSFKAVAIASGQSSRRVVAAATVFLDRILGLVALIWVGAIGAWLTRNVYTSEIHVTIRTVFWVASGVGTLGFIAMLIPAITHSKLVSWCVHLPIVGKIFQQLLDAVSLYQKRPGVLLGCALMAIFGHSLMIASMLCCALGLGGWAPDLAAHLYFMPAAEIFGLIPTPAGIGPQEFAIQEGYGALAKPPITPELAKQAGLFAGLAFRLNHMLIAALGAIFLLSAKPREAAAIEAQVNSDGTGELAAK